MLSVIIPTRNRADLLGQALESLAAQTARRGDLDVIVIDDGSTDHTAEVCRAFAPALELQYGRIPPSGIAAAKNVGIFTSRRSLLLFSDDDDLADPDLCRQHLEAHARHPRPNVAILGYTDLAPTLTVTPLMRFLTEVGQVLFSYPSMRDGEVLDWRAFWGGRTSCKREFLVNHGVFHRDFTFGSEADELGYRLSRYGLEVVFHRGAVQHLNRGYTFDEFCQRCEREGLSQWRFSRLHPDPMIQEHCQVIDARRRWEEAHPRLAATVARVREIEAELEALSGQLARPESLEGELMRLYDWTFKAFKLKGVMRAMRAGQEAGDAG